MVGSKRPRNVSGSGVAHYICSGDAMRMQNSAPMGVRSSSGFHVDRAVMAGGWWLPPGSDDVAEVLAERYSLPNPAWSQWVKRRERVRFPGPEPDELLTVVHPIPDGPWAGGWYMPRCVPLSVGAPVSRLVAPDAVTARLVESLTLRPHQRAALEAVTVGGSALIEMPCGAGKTTFGEAVIALVPSPALILVHTLDLAKQWTQRIAEQMQSVSVGLVGAGKRQDDRRVVVATLQTLSRWGWWERYEWAQRFGLVILDEAHHAPAATFSEVLSTIPAATRIGLTATPVRHDGLTAFVGWNFGQTAYRVTTQDLDRAGLTMAPEVVWVETGWSPPDEDMANHERVAAMVEDYSRNLLVVDTAKRALADGRTVLVLADRVAHCRQLAALITREGYPAEALVGDVSAKRRDEILGRARAGELRCVTATSVADEGLDLPGLDCVIFASPSGNLGRVQQRAGRAGRVCTGKRQPLVYDLVDDWGPYRGYARRRKKLYRSLGWSA